MNKSQYKIRNIIELIYELEMPIKRKTTQGQYKVYLAEIAHELGDWLMNEFSLLEFEKWMQAFRKRKLRKTFNDYSKFLNKIYTFAYQRRLTNHRLVFPMTDPRKGQVGRIYSNVEIEGLTAFMSQDLLDQYTISIECYMRLMEVLQLERGMIDLDDECFRLSPEHVKTGSKTGLGRVIPWTENVREIVLRRLQTIHTRYLFPNKRGTNHVRSNKSAWTSVKEKAGIKGRSRWHDLRGTALTAAVYRDKKNISQVAKVAGLSVRTLERVYAQPDVEQLRDAVGAITL